MSRCNPATGPFQCRSPRYLKEKRAELVFVDCQLGKRFNQSLMGELFSMREVSG